MRKKESKDLEELSSLVEISMKVSMLMINGTDGADSSGLMAPTIKDSGPMEWEMAMASSCMPQVR